MEKILQQLTKLQEEIKKAEMEKSEFEGRIKVQMETLHSKFDVPTIEEAEELLKEIESQMITTSETIKQKYAKLEEEFQW